MLCAETTWVAILVRGSHGRDNVDDLETRLAAASDRLLPVIITIGIAPKCA